MGGLNIYPLSLEASSSRSRCQQGWIPLGALRENLHGSFPASRGCWPSFDVPWLVDAKLQSRSHCHVAFSRGCLCPNSPLVKGQQPLDWVPPNPGDLISKLTLITSAQVLSPNVTIVSGSRMDMNCGDTIPPRTDGNMRVVGRQGRRGGWISFDAAWPPGLSAGWTQEKCLHSVDGACAWTRLHHWPWRLHANVFPVTAPSLLIVAHEGHHCWSPDRLGSRPPTVDRGSEDRVPV